MRFRSYLFFFALLLLSLATPRVGKAFTFTGPTVVGLNSTYTYSYTDGTIYQAPSWGGSRASVQSTWSVGTTYYATVKWTSTGTGSLSFIDQGDNIVYTTNVTISSCTTVTTPSTTGATRFCSGSVTLTASDPGSGYAIRWYDATTTTLIVGTGLSYATPSLSTSATYYASKYLTSTGCESAKVAVTATINSPTVAASGTTTICSGTTTAITLTNPNNYSGVTYTWSSTSSNVSGASSGTANPIAQTLTATTSASGTATYTASAVSGGCVGPSVQVVITVKPMPTLQVVNSAPAVCTGQASTNIALSNPNNVSGTTYSWSLTSQSNISGASSATNTSSTSIAQAITCTTANLTGSVTYSVTASSNGCTTQPISATVTVNPVPTAAVSPASVSICSGTNQTLSLTNPNNVSGTIYNWTSIPVNATVPVDDGVGTSITGVFLNADGVNTGSASYSITPKTANCTGAPVSAALTINTAPVAPTPATVVTYNNSATLQITVPSNAQAQWYATNVSGTVLSSSSSYPITGTNNSFQTYYVTLKSLASPYCETSRAAMTAAFIPLIAPASITQEIVRTSGITSEDNVIALSTTQKAVGVSYLDGLARTAQVLAINSTTLGKDVVQPVEYDNYGHTAKDYLPYTATTNSAYQSNYVTAQASFYNNTTDKVADDTNPFKLAKYELSPFARLKEQGGVGTAWQPGTQHTTQVGYSFNSGVSNDDLEEVRKFASDGTSTGYYSVNTLSRTSSTDEDGNLTVIFTDGSGRTVAKKQQSGSSAYLQTYYIYDDLGRLKYIIPPAGLAALKANSWTLTQTITDDHLHQFVYDNRGRTTQKKTPGQAWSYLCYDNLNRLILSQDGNQRPQNKWAFVKYDLYGRSVMTGLYTNTTVTGQANMQTLLTGYTPQYEKKGGTLYGYTNTAFPTVNADNSALEIWSVNYYDDYSFTLNNGASPVYDNTHLPGLQTKATAYTRGMLTGSRKLIVGSSNWIVSAVFYDDYGRVIQTQGNNHLYLNGLDKSSTVYDFEKAVQTKLTHSPDGTNITNIVQTPVYYPQGRVQQLTHSINGATPQIVAQYEYNELGQVVDKKLHYNSSNSKFLQSIDYRYNIKGWLASINNAQLTTDSGVTNEDADSNLGDFFGMEMLYNTAQTGLNDQAGDQVYYNGNAGAIKWKSLGAKVGAEEQRSYKFLYDNAGRLLNATFQKSSASAWDKENNTLNENMTYDANGNIKTLTRNHNLRGLSSHTVTATPETIDNLAYTYLNNANSLTKVDDTGLTDGFANGTNSGDDYTYDTHGNLLTDQNKGITSITYNMLGKISAISFGATGKSVSYTYDASGNKLSMVSTVNSVATITDYTTGFVYTTVSSTRTLNFISSPEGRVVKNGSNYEYQYAITDYQGNTRILFTSAAPQVETRTATYEGSDDVAYYKTYPGTTNFGTVNNHTTSGSHSQILYAGMVGIGHSYHVYAGDKVQIDAWGMYRNLSGSNNSDLTGFATTLLTAFQLSAPGPGETGTAASGINTFGALEAGGWGDGSTDNTDVRAFVNIILFDKNYKFLDAAYAQLTATTAGTFVAMTQNYIAKEEGYAYLYISNENLKTVDVYFDDVTMTYTPSNIIQANEYYPFGLQTAQSWTRAGNTNNFLYNEGSEMNNVSGMYDLPFRNYDASVGRFFQMDPLSLQSHSETPYHYAGNDPIGFNDPSGLMKAETFWNSINTLLHSEHGGWADDSGIHEYQNDIDAAEDAATYISTHGGWAGAGGGGGAYSYEEMMSRYFKQKGVIILSELTVEERRANSDDWLSSRINRAYDILEYSVDFWSTMNNPNVQAIHDGQQAFVNNPAGGFLMAFLTGAPAMGLGNAIRGVAGLMRLSAPVARTLLFGSQLTRSKMAVNATAEVINQLASGTNWKEIDVFDVAAQSVLGFNSLGSILIASNINFTPLSGQTNDSFGWSSNFGTAKGTSDMATSSVAGLVTEGLGSKLPFGSGIILMMGIDWIMKVEANQLSKTH